MQHFSTRARLALALLLTAFATVAPGQMGSPFAGPPASEAGRWMLVGLLWLATMVAVIPPRRAIPLTLLGVLACAPAAQVWLGRQAPTRGWQGAYEMRDEPAERARFSWRFRSRAFRIDPRIDFDGPNFGLHFLNDLKRYGRKYHVQYPRDTEVPLRVTWRGTAALPEPALIAVAAEANGAVVVRLDGATVLTSPGPLTKLAVPTAGNRPAGPVNIEVIYDKPAGIPPKIAVRFWSPATGEFDVGAFGAPPDGSRPTQALDGSAAVVMLAAGFLMALLYWAYRPLLSLEHGSAAWRVAAPQWAILAAFGALLYGQARHVIPLLHNTVYLWAGDDPLAYVSNARNILLEGWLMPGGAPLGHGSPFYFYPLFGYVMGFAHWVMGEDFAVVQLVNGWSVAALIPLAYALGWRRRPWWTVVVGTMALYWLIARHMLPYVQAGYTDSVFTGLVFVTLVLCRQAVTASASWAVAAGVSCALAAAARPSFLTFTPLFIVTLIVLGRTAGVSHPRRTAALVLAGFVLGMLPFALRNAIVSGQFVVLVSSWIQLPYFLIAPEVSPNPVPGMFAGIPSLTESLAAAFRLIAADPLGIAALELRKVAFTFGFTQWGVPGTGAHPEFLLLSLLYVVAVVARRLPPSLLLVTGVFTVSHVSAMVLAAPWTYGYKSILPLQAVFLFGTLYLLPGLGQEGVTPAVRESEVPHVARA